MPTCPDGHQSTDDEWCDLCGLALVAPPSGPPLSTVPPEGVAAESAPPPGPSHSGATSAPHTQGDGHYCPDCGLGRTGNFCEGCGFAFNEPRQVTGSQPIVGSAEVWTAIVAAEPSYFQILADRGFLDPHVVRFPSRAPQRRIRLVGERIRIGRRNAKRGIDPEIDLAEATEDPAISHHHAELRARGEGAWAIVDLDSVNGTAVNDAEEYVTPHVEIEVRDGDRIFLGAWTVITLRRG